MTVGSEASSPHEKGEPFMEISEQSFAAANRRGKKVQAAYPEAVAVRFDRSSARLVISLSTGVDISFSPKLDADLYIPALLQGFGVAE
jgi:hypothetical protein